MTKVLGDGFRFRLKKQAERQDKMDKRRERFLRLYNHLNHHMAPKKEDVHG